MESPITPSVEPTLTKEEREAKRKQVLEVKKAMALKLLLDGKSKVDVAAETNLQMRHVAQVEAELIAKQQHGVLLASYVEQRKSLLPKVLSCGLNLIANGLKHRLDSGEVLDLKEAEIVSRIVSNIDHIARLDAGDPTTIVDVNRTIPATLNDMVRALKKDPFIDTLQLAKEITHDTGNDADSRTDDSRGKDPESGPDNGTPQG